MTLVGCSYAWRFSPLDGAFRRRVSTARLDGVSRRRVSAARLDGAFRRRVSTAHFDGWNERLECRSAIGEELRCTTFDLRRIAISSLGKVSFNWEIHRHGSCELV
jgi:hypothetical protein